MLRAPGCQARGRRAGPDGLAAPRGRAHSLAFPTLLWLRAATALPCRPGLTPHGTSLRHALQHSTPCLLGNVASRAVAFLAIPFYSRFLSPAQYGLLELVELSTQTTAIAFGLAGHRRRPGPAAPRPALAGSRARLGIDRADLRRGCLPRGGPALAGAAGRAVRHVVRGPRRDDVPLAHRPPVGSPAVQGSLQAHPRRCAGAACPALSMGRASEAASADGPAPRFGPFMISRVARCNFATVWQIPYRNLAL